LKNSFQLLEAIFIYGKDIFEICRFCKLLAHSLQIYSWSVIMSKNYYSGETLKSYMKEVNRYTLLKASEELELSRKVADGSEEARQRLINCNLRLVVKLANLYTNQGMPLMDLIQEGNLGLIKAAEKFDYRKEVRFSTYACWWIKQAISRALINKKRTIRLPHRKEDALRRVMSVMDEFQNEFMRSPTIEEIAERTSLSEENILYLLEVSGNPVSLDNDSNLDKGTLMDLVEDPRENPDQALLKKNMIEDTQRFLNMLKDREKEVISYRYSLYDGEKYTLKEVSHFMGISPETVRQIEIRAIKKLRDQAQSMKEYMFC